MDNFDIIIIGGGSAGSAVAGRLSADPQLRICLIEAGGHNDVMAVKTPGLLPFIPDSSKYDFDTVPQAGLNGRVGYQPRGRGLGGSSAINAMLYIRGNGWDYDQWAQLGATGWSFADCLPYFKRAESNERGADAFHGADGPLHVMDQHWPNAASRAFVEAAAALQLPLNTDFNGATQDGFGLYQVTQKGGERWSSARAYVEPNRGRVNLDIRTGVLVERILVEDGRATGVAISRNGQRSILRAAGGVVLSAGAFNSPQILMLSGIGPADHLAEKGISLVHDLPGVGENLQDHIDYVVSYRTQSNIPFGTSMAGTWRMARAFVQHRWNRTGMMTTPFAESGGFWRTRTDLPAPDVQYHFIPAMLDDHGRNQLKGHGFSCHVCVLRPESRGNVRLNDADPLSPPRIDPGFLSDRRDVETLMAGARMMARICAAPPLSDLGGAVVRPVNVDDDAALEQEIRNRADTVYHPVGSCRMGGDAAAVVNPQLALNGVDGLWVADASIMPRLVSGNTNAPSIMIGERAADFVAAALK
ncbi:MAG: GMC family oxidoreductase N-terminal domain-containing protein [Sphingomonadaceae bacterium]|nr:GMC family oxidoreductase N-terminal domain-containing protein [Sphingomonadaceae bacterium]